MVVFFQNFINFVLPKFYVFYIYYFFYSELVYEKEKKNKSAIKFYFKYFALNKGNKSLNSLSVRTRSECNLKNGAVFGICY